MKKNFKLLVLSLLALSCSNDSNSDEIANTDSKYH